jgi:hypothetical protein
MRNAVARLASAGVYHDIVLQCAANRQPRNRASYGFFGTTAIELATQPCGARSTLIPPLPAWSVDEQEACFIVRDARRDEARRIAANIAKLPGRATSA